MRDRDAAYNNMFRANAASALLLQLVSAAVGIILPRLILGAYGSEANGLVSSITQFLSYIALMEAGTGSVMRAAMYKPLADGDMLKLSGVVNACRRFFCGIAFAFLGYLAILAFAYPLLAKNENFSYDFILTLVLILGINTLTQYFLSLANTLLLQAHQKIYISNLLEIGTLIVNLILSVILIRSGAELRVLKLMTALLFLVRPGIIYVYVKKRYAIDKTVPPDNTAVSQRWDGLGHHLAFFAHKNTDVVVLTFFSTYQEISVYSVYIMVTNAIQMALNSISSSITAKLGDLFVRNDRDGLERSFARHETLTYVVATLLFSVTNVMIVPFVGVYTQDITDVNYLRQGFSLLMVLAEFIYAVRAPYSNLAFAVGAFKDTRNGALIEAVINILVSLALVSWLGISGVAVGTLIAMLYRTVDYVIYLSKNILCRPLKHFARNVSLSAVSYVLISIVGGVLVVPLFKMNDLFNWAVCAAIITAIATMILCAVQLMFNRKSFLDSFKLFI